MYAGRVTAPTLQLSESDWQDFFSVRPTAPELSLVNSTLKPRFCGNEVEKRELVLSKAGRQREVARKTNVSELARNRTLEI
jgi:hypothetical protein